LMPGEAIGKIRADPMKRHLSNSSIRSGGKAREVVCDAIFQSPASDKRCSFD
jgi:hypothetical protein